MKLFHLRISCSWFDYHSSMMVTGLCKHWRSITLYGLRYDLVMGWPSMNKLSWTSFLNEWDELVHNLEINSFINSLSFDHWAKCQTFLWICHQSKPYQLVTRSYQWSTWSNSTINSQLIYKPNINRTRLCILTSRSFWKIERFEFTEQVHFGEHEWLKYLSGH